MKKYLGTGSLLIGSLALFLMSTGCASTTLTLSSNHPARTDAPSGQVQSEPAAVLRPDAPLYPSEALAATGEVGNRQNEQVSSPDGTREAPYVGQGVIQGDRRRPTGYPAWGDPWFHGSDEDGISGR